MDPWSERSRELPVIHHRFIKENSTEIDQISINIDEILFWTDHWPVG